MSKFDKHILNCYYFCNKLHYYNKHKFIKNIVYKYYSFILKYLFGSFIPYKAKLGKNIRFRHSFHGIFISQHAIIGDNCEILHQVTIGSNTKMNNVLAPKIGNNVFIGVNALIIGNSIVEDNCKIGAGVIITNKHIKKNSTVYTDNITIKIM